MSRWRTARILVVLAAGLAFAAGTVAAVAATRDGDDEAGRAAAQEETNGDEQPWLGVIVRPSEEPAGLAVRHVAPESPAADAGLERGDVITAIDGQSLTEFEQLAEAIEAKAVGDLVTLTVVRNGVEEPDAEASEVEVALAARPEGEDLKERIGDEIGGLFERFVDGQFRYLDEDGKTVTVEVVAGTVSSVSEDEITIDVNGDDEGERSFSIPDDVEVPQGLREGDQTAVVVKDGEVEQILPGGFPVPLPGLVPDVFPVPDGGFDLPFGGEGEGLSVEVISGTVSSVSADEITLDLGGDEGEKSFTIPDGVEVPEGLEAGEQAIVLIRNGEVAKIVEGAGPIEDGFELPFDEILPRPRGEPPSDDGETGFPKA